MGTALVVISGLGLFASIGIFVISMLRKLFFKLTKNTEKMNKARKCSIISAITFGAFLIIFIATMIIGPKLDPVGWCTSHEYNIVEQKDSTCTNSGYIIRVCSLCGDETKETIDAHHSWVEQVVEKATCTSKQKIEKKCSRCGTTEYIESGEVLAHTWEKDKVIEATCSHPKQTINKCSVCGTSETVEEGSTLPHNFGEWTTIIEPTTEKEGQQARTCTICNHSEKTNILKKSPITIMSITYNIDYVGGVEWTYDIKNNSPKTIKYITLQWSCYNAVGDPIYDEIDGQNITGMKITGPLESGQSKQYTNATKFYNHSYASSSMVTISVEFMDGDIINITDSEYTNIFKN
ncbi:MAG: hypothetical protein J6A55_06860 [Oscillospiraceae bacterium]|nr:hypothetical protein [Oscillospiraceae bacterium]